MLRYIQLSISIIFVFSTSFAQQPTYDLEIIVTGLRNTNGQIMISLNKGSKDFPHKNYYRQLFLNNFSAPQFNLTLKNIPQGNYAVSLLHDEDDNGKMKRNLIGIPKEGFAFSRNYKVLLRAPKYSEANFEIDTIKKPLIINLQY